MITTALAPVCVATVEAEVREKPALECSSGWAEHAPTGYGWFRCAGHGIDVFDRMPVVVQLAREHAGV